MTTPETASPLERVHVRVRLVLERLDKAAAERNGAEYGLAPAEAEILVDLLNEASNDLGDWVREE